MRKFVLILPMILVLYACSDLAVNTPEGQDSEPLVTQQLDESAFLNTPDHAQSPVIITFSKSAVVEGKWEGSVDGDVSGNLKSELLDMRESGPIWHVEFDWIIDSGEQSFTARLNGILNNRTGSVVMNGRVIEGWLEGARGRSAC